ncbi:SAM-dependent DNA methyltransferase [Chitinophaga varians]|uniref:site-specific DNA-methyltransferase (adenine-specific) n=1 Tax=Chitinophaga varians TaxID=2202339 RepID=A0A847RIV5_9BACT|nr:class I SAM-dependent DNA methyltransferase [Chitinophaga varians]NLR63023.1 SAM-dependent DNA methyltransferase [Chitinophaga varians]
MNHTQHNQIVNFIWSIADDVLRDVYTRGKYRDIILPFTVLRRLDALLETTKDKVISMHEQLNKLKIDNQSPQLCKVSGYVFYNTSPYTFKKLLNDPANIRRNLENYLDGFSSDVQDIISKFKLRNQLDTLEEGNITFPLIEKFCSAQINLSPVPVKDKEGNIIHAGLSNLGMGYVFEELIRKFNEENNEEAGEHFTPREIIKLMTHLIFDPIKDKIKEGTYLIYDPACGSGGMLTEAEHFALEINPKATFHLYGQEVNPETFAICKADMLIKEEDPEKIAFGSTLSNDGFPKLKFDFMLSNPPYGKTWKIDQESIIDLKTKEILDQRFAVGVPRVSDGQLLFLMNMVSKMKTDSEIGSRIASVHNGSSLFTGDAGSGESEMRKYIIENDLLEAIIQLPNDMFYNTGIATYIWVLSNKKIKNRKGKVQLIDASGIFRKMRKGLGSKSNELSEAHIQEITSVFTDCKETPISRIFDNDDFAYWNITVDRPLRLSWQLTEERLAGLDNKELFMPVMAALQKKFGKKIQQDYNELSPALDEALKKLAIKWKPKERKTFLDAISQKDETAMPVIKKQERGTTVYEADTELRDYENIPVKQNIQAYFEKEVLPFVPDAWIDHDKTVKGYEISFTKIFYQYQPLRSVAEITEEIMQLEKETEGLLNEIIS